MTPVVGQLLEKLGVTERDLFFSFIASMFILDFGVVKATDQATVDVEHAIAPKINGKQLPTTVTEGVQVVWPSGGAVSTKWTIAEGDPVLLLGLKDYVADVASGVPGATDIGHHYARTTMKAMPIGAFNGSATVQIVESGGVLSIVPSGAQPAARKGDATTADATTDAANFPLLQAVCGIFGMTLAKLDGKVNAGSAKVKIGG